MSALDAAGWALSRSQSVSVVPDDPVPAPRDDEQHATSPSAGSARSSSGSGPWARPGGCPWTPGRGTARAPPISAWVSSVHTPVALTTCLARISYSPPPSHVLHPGADDPLALAQEADDPGAVGDLRAVRRRRADQGRHIPGVVHLRVVVLQRPDQGVLLQAGRHPQRVPAREVTVHGQAAAVSARRSTSRRRARRPSPRSSRSQPLCCKRIQERHRLHQVRREPLQQQPALLQRLPDEREVQHLQIAQAAVDELARPARRARRPVTRLDQPGGQAAGRRVQRGARRRPRPRPPPARPVRARPFAASASARSAGPSVAVLTAASRCRRARLTRPREAPAHIRHAPSLTPCRLSDTTSRPPVDNSYGDPPGHARTRNPAYRSYLRLV